jgi:hypothetical protein
MERDHGRMSGSLHLPVIRDEVQIEPGKARSMHICIWCGNNNRDVCQEECQPEGKYRHLAPVPPDPWEVAPSPPDFRELVDLPAAERLAVLWLSVYYLDRAHKRE